MEFKEERDKEGNSVRIMLWAKASSHEYNDIYKIIKIREKWKTEIGEVWRQRDEGKDWS